MACPCPALRAWRTRSPSPGVQGSSWSDLLRCKHVGSARGRYRAEAQLLSQLLIFSIASCSDLISNLTTCGGFLSTSASGSM